MEQQNGQGSRNQKITVAVWLSFTAVIVWKILIQINILPRSIGENNLWWTVFLLWGAMLTGFLFQPMVKRHFRPKRVANGQELKLSDHETLMGYYPIVALGVAAGSLVASPFLYGAETFFKVTSPYFWPATLATGILNVCIFYFFTKGLRYGDVSLVSVTQSLNPVVSLPISLLVFAVLGSRAHLSNPAVSWTGFLGIMIVVLAIALNAIINRKPSQDQTKAPAGDWFANHPVWSGILSTVFAGIAVNFDKVAIDSANPFLAGTLMAAVVSVITFFWTTIANGWSRVKKIFGAYWKEFVMVGLAYAGVILVMNIALFGANVNYYASIKRASAIFGTFYGIYVLREGGGAKEKWTRIAVSLAVIIGIVLITLKG